MKMVFAILVVILCITWIVLSVYFVNSIISEIKNSKDDNWKFIVILLVFSLINALLYTIGTFMLLTNKF